jgi:hypothetical protein
MTKVPKIENIQKGYGIFKTLVGLAHFRHFRHFI